MDEPVCQEALIPFGFEFGDRYLRDHHPSVCPDFRTNGFFNISACHVYCMAFFITLADCKVSLVRAQDD